MATRSSKKNGAAEGGSKEVATRTKAGAVGAALDFASDAGKGTEGADASSFAIPFIAILQKISPAVETVKGAKEGLFINTITNELAETVRVVPCGFRRRFLLWAPRKDGGGFKGEFSPLDVETGKVKYEQREDENGIQRMYIGKDILTDTRMHFVLVETKSGSWVPAMLSLKSTQIKKSKRWLSMITGIEMKDAKGKTFNPPSFSHIYVLSTIKEENNQGKWHGLEVAVDGPIDDAELYAKAREFNAQCAKGEVVIDHNKDADRGEEEGGDGKKF